MRAGIAQGGLNTPVLFSLYVNDMASPSHRFELVLYAEDTAIIATTRKPMLLVSYLESKLNDLQRWLSEWRIAINVSKSLVIIFARAGRRFIQPRPVTLPGTNQMGRHNSLSGGDSRYTTCLEVSHRSGQEEGYSKFGYAGSLMNRKSYLSIRNGVLLYK